MIVAYCSCTFAFSTRRVVGVHGRVERRDRRPRGVDLLARRDAALRQLLEALGLLRRVGGLREVAIEVGLRLLQRRFERTTIEREERPGPAVTSSPSVKLTLVSWPVVCARIATLENGSAAPMTLISIGIDFWTTVPTATGTGPPPPPPRPPLPFPARRRSRGAFLAGTTGDDHCDQQSTRNNEDIGFA